MIKSFACKETEALFRRQSIPKIPFEIQRVALRKLKMLDAAENLEDLRVPYGNRLEKLYGETVKINLVSGLMTSGGFVFVLNIPKLPMLRLSIIIKSEE